jgi:subtilisin family serine protease
VTLFDATGTRLTAPTPRQKPDVVGPDGGSNTFLGQNIGAKTSTTNAACDNGTQFPNFRGTSAATPHVASVAALLLEADPGQDVDDLYTIMRISTVPMTPQSPYIVGSGFIQADLAAEHTPQLVPPAPVLTLASTSTQVGSSDALTWTSSNNQSCMASGAWSGTQLSNGQMTITPTAAGTAIYTLVCSNAKGTSPATSVTLTVTAASTGGGGHGGGSFDLTVLLALSGLIAHRAARTRRAALN